MKFHFKILKKHFNEIFYNENSISFYTELPIFGSIQPIGPISHVNIFDLVGKY